MVQCVYIIVESVCGVGGPYALPSNRLYKGSFLVLVWMVDCLAFIGCLKNRIPFCRSLE